MAKKPVKMIVGPRNDEKSERKPGTEKREAKTRPGKTLGGKARYMRGLK